MEEILIEGFLKFLNWLTYAPTYEILLGVYVFLGILMVVTRGLVYLFIDSREIFIKDKKLSKILFALLINTLIGFVEYGLLWPITLPIILFSETEYWFEYN